MTKIFSLTLKFLSTPFFVGCLLSCVLAGLVQFYYISYRDPAVVEQYPLLSEVERLHNQTIDFRLRQRGPRKGSDDVAILTIDEKAIQKYGRWPWPRTLIANVIDGIMKHGARSIAFDIIFSEKQETMLNSLDSIQGKLKKNLPKDAGALDKVFAEEKIKLDHDRHLTAAIERHSAKMILGAVYDEFEYHPFPFQDACFLDITKKNDVFDYWDKESYLIGLQNAAEVALPTSWHNILLDHFDNLQQNVSYQWLQDNPDHPVSHLLEERGFSLSKKGTVLLLTLFIQQKKELYEETDFSKTVPWNTLSRLFPHKELVDVRADMRQELNDYCLRYLTSKDELTPTFKENWDTITKEYDKFQGLTFDQAVDYIQITNLSNPVHHVDRWLFNIPSINDVVEHSGTFNATQDKDGSVRRAKLFVRNGSLFIPSLAFKTFLVVKDLYPTANLLPNPYENPPESNIVTNVKLENGDGEHVLTIPTDHRGQLQINYAGPQKMFSYLSAGEILDDKPTLTIQQRLLNKDGDWIEEEFEVDRLEYLKDKNFIFGATATGIYDLRVTPFEENYPGVETHANLLDNLLRQDYLKTNPKEAYVMPFFVLVLGILFSFVVSYFGALIGLFIATLSLFAIYLVDTLLIFPKGTVVTILFPIATIATLYTFLTFFKYFTEERKKKQLKGTFQKYVSPEIVEEILKDPSKLELGGMKVEMSVFFSDIRGFTTISEQLDPKALSDLLNHYLTPMTDIIFKNSGTLDKYMGDAIMAFFGAPVPSKTHAAQACRASLLQIEKLFELQKIYEAQGLPMLDIGIGVNTGEMSVGNMGSETVRNYTVMGDAVNLGARLEGINKQYGTRIIISEFTRAQISEDEFLFREIDWVKVKGKNEPVRIFELMDMGETTAEQKAQVQHFNSGFNFYHEMQFEKATEEFNAALKVNAADLTSQLYIKRCQDYIKQPPEKNWDGVFTMTTK